MTDPTRPGDRVGDSGPPLVGFGIPAASPIGPPAPVAALVEPCNAAATMIVFRGKTRRLYLCAAHRGRYTGSGKVAPYRGLSQFDPPEDPRPGEFTGPVRRCGEETA